MLIGLWFFCTSTSGFLIKSIKYIYIYTHIHVHRHNHPITVTLTLLKSDQMFSEHTNLILLNQIRVTFISLMIVTFICGPRWHLSRMTLMRMVNLKTVWFFFFPLQKCWTGSFLIPTPFLVQQCWRQSTSNSVWLYQSWESSRWQYGHRAIALPATVITDNALINLIINLSKNKILHTHDLIPDCRV